MFTCAGYPLRELLLTLPIKGQATARVEYLADDVISGAVEIRSPAGDRLIADVYRAGKFVYTGRAILRTCGALARSASAEHFQGLSVDALVNNAISSVGVTRDRTVRGPSLVLTHWTRPGLEPITSELNALSRRAGEGITWRTTLDGRVRFGAETWPTIADEVPAEVLDERPDERTILVGTERLFLLPGYTWRGVRIAQVEYAFNEDHGMRATLWRV